MLRALVCRLLLSLNGLLFRRKPFAVVLMYHHVGNGLGRHTVPFPAILRQVRDLQRRGLRIVPAEEIARWKPEDGSCCAVTFDDGYIDNLALKDIDVPVTIFVTTAPDSAEMGSLPSDTDPRALVIQLKSHNHIRFGSHGISHKRWTRMSAEELERELVESKRTIEDWSRQSVSACAYPKGSSNPDVEELVSRHFACAFLADGGAMTSSVANCCRIPRVGIFGNTSLPEFRLRTSPLFPLLIHLRKVWKR